MALVLLPVGGVFLGKLRVVDHEQIFGVVEFGLGGEVEAAGDDNLTINDDDLIVENVVRVVYQARDSGLPEHGQNGTPLSEVAGIKDAVDLNTGIVLSDEGSGDGGKGELVGHEQNGLVGGRDGLNDGVGASPGRGEVDLSGCIHG